MKQTIMVVDDEPIITATLATLLEMTFDCHVIVHNNPVEALNDAKLHEKAVDILVTDFMMPQIDGFELIKKVQAVHPKCINILLTGYADKNSAIQSINELNLYYYLEKPWQNDDLVKVIQNGFEKKSLELAYDRQYIELEKSSLEIQRLYALLQKDYKQEMDKNSNLSEWNKELEEAVVERTFALQSILDNVGQGFLVLARELKISREYSLECVQIFGKEIGNMSLSALLYPNDVEEQMFLDDLIRDILASNDPEHVDLLMPLLPEEVMIRNKPIKLEFRIIQSEQLKHIPNAQNTFMVVLTDVSEQRHLENLIESERNTLKMVVAAVVHHRDLIDSLKDYALFIEKTLENMLQKKVSSEEKLATVFRAIHTFKGTFAQLGLISSTKNLHEIESQLAKWKEPMSSGMTFVQWMNQLNLHEVIRKDFDTLVDYLGKDFLKQDELLFVDKERLLDIEFDVMRLFDGDEGNRILKQLRQLRYKPFKSLLEPLKPYVMRLSEELNKPMAPLAIIGDDLAVDLDVYSGLSKSLVHIVRNAMDHGIESIEERHLLNKPYLGNITCELTLEVDQLILSISNDGKTIDLQTIRDKAGRLGYEVKDMPDDQLLMLLFEDAFSTATDVSLMSGRGIGLSAVKYEVEKIEGSIDVASDENMTVFKIRMPIIEQQAFDKGIYFDKMLNGLSQSIETQFGVSFTKKRVTDENMETALCAMIEVTGGCNFSVKVVMDQPLLDVLTQMMTLGNVEPEEGLKESILTEFINTLVGNELVHMPLNGHLLDISTPKTCTQAVCELSKEKATMSMQSDLGRLTLSIDY